MADHWSGEEELLAELGEAVRSAREVPARFVEAGKAAFSWRDLDAEFAALSYDSVAAAGPTGVRADAAPLRALTFSGRDFTIELEVGSSDLHGQVVPAQPGELDVETRDGTVLTVPVDDVGWFAVRPKPAGRFRLRLRTGSGHVVLTDWTTV
ncbi:hypothetical protein ABZ342_23325 [Amycolatopsis sp. NPDC005961]|uniref:hypothetical protein n=1 Tax=Amycolatopsis sp. NPDC005961 TaxID=3156720 RepID=UPI00340CC037